MKQAIQLVFNLQAYMFFILKPIKKQIYLVAMMGWLAFFFSLCGCSRMDVGMEQGNQQDRKSKELCAQWDFEAQLTEDIQTIIQECMQPRFPGIERIESLRNLLVNKTSPTFRMLLMEGLQSAGICLYTYGGLILAENLTSALSTMSFPDLSHLPFTATQAISTISNVRRDEMFSTIIGAAEEVMNKSDDCAGLNCVRIALKIPFNLIKAIVSSPDDPIEKLERAKVAGMNYGVTKIAPVISALTSNQTKIIELALNETSYQGHNSLKDAQAMVYRPLLINFVIASGAMVCLDIMYSYCTRWVTNSFSEIQSKIQSNEKLNSLANLTKNRLRGSSNVKSKNWKIEARNKELVETARTDLEWLCFKLVELTRNREMSAANKKKIKERLERLLSTIPNDDAGQSSSWIVRQVFKATRRALDNLSEVPAPSHVMDNIV